MEVEKGVEKVTSEEDDEVKRFLLDLEFVQCLANPEYLQCSFLERRKKRKKER